MRRHTLAAVTLAFLAGAASQQVRADDTEADVAAPVGAVVLKLHAVGAQIYACQRLASGALAWQFREPVATLLEDGRTVGRHFAGPAWELADGSGVVGKVVAKAPGASPADIPWLRLEVAAHGGAGRLAPVTTVQRVATSGGNRSGACDAEGALAAEPYAADYVFSRPR